MKPEIPAHFGFPRRPIGIIILEIEAVLLGGEFGPGVISVLIREGIKRRFGHPKLSVSFMKTRPFKKKSDKFP